MQIVCGTDFSENAAAAGIAAAALAQRWGDTLALAHVVEKSLSERLPRDVRETLAASICDRLHDEATHLAQGGVKVVEHTLAGTPDQALADLAVRSNARLVVLSSVGHRPRDWLLGSVAERTAEHCPVPTLVVRSTAPFEAWARGERPLKVFVAVDFTDAADRALHWVKHLVSAGSCEVVLGYVDWPLGERARLGLEWDPFQVHNPPEVQAILKREMRERASEVLGRTDVRVRSEPSMGRADFRLVEMASEEQADLLVTATHQRHGVSRFWHPSISRALLRHAPMNVLCVPIAYPDTILHRSAPIHRVLVAVAVSKYGGRAIPFAYGIVNSGGTVRLLHVATPIERPNPITGDYPTPEPSVKSEHARMLAEVRERLRSLIPEDATSRNIATDVTVVEADDVANAIRQEAERFGADVICVGAHDHPGLSQAVLGSVAEAVTTQSGRPVLVVREPEP